MTRSADELRVLGVLKDIEPLGQEGFPLTRIVRLSGVPVPRVVRALQRLYERDEVSYRSQWRDEPLWRPTSSGRARLAESVDLDRALSLSDFKWAVPILVALIGVLAAVLA